MGFKFADDPVGEFFEVAVGRDVGAAHLVSENVPGEQATALGVRARYRGVAGRRAGAFAVENVRYALLSRAGA